MSSVPTIAVVMPTSPTGYALINVSDYNPETDTKYEAPAEKPALEIVPPKPPKDAPKA